MEESRGAPCAYVLSCMYVSRPHVRCRVCMRCQSARALSTCVAGDGCTAVTPCERAHAMRCERAHAMSERERERERGREAAVLAARRESAAERR